MKRALVVTILLTACVAAAAEAKQPAWTLESRQCRFPGVGDQDYAARGSLTRHNDTWVFVYSHGSTHQHRPPHVIRIHFSEDEGRTWSEADKLPDGTAVKGAPFKPRDPANELSEGIILTCPNNDLLVLGRENTDRVFHGMLQLRSRDGGRTWREEESLILNQPGMHGPLDWVVVGKTIYLPLMIHETSSTRSPLTVELYQSTDNGKSWQHVARIGETAEEVNETGIEYLGGTTLVTVYRTRGERNTLLRRSDDMGKTWQPLVDIGKDVGAVQQPKLRRFADEPGRLYLFGRDRIEEYVQRNAVWYSDDQGRTWTQVPLDEKMFRDTGYGEALKRKDGSLYYLGYRGSDAKADMWEYVLRPTAGLCVAAEAKKPTGDQPCFEIWDEEFQWNCGIVVAMDGTVLLLKEQREKGIVEVKRSEDGGKTWGAEIEVGKRVKVGGDMSDDGRYRGEHVPYSGLGSAVVDENTGDVLVFAGNLKPAQILYRSRDHGKTWKTEDIEIKPDKNGWLSTTFCCDPGVTLRYGKPKGRLLLPTQVFVGAVDGEKRTYLNKGQNRKYFHTRYANSLYSDDGGKTWVPSEPFPLLGTSEPSLAELSDGRIYFNARTHSRGGNKRIAHSHDGGQTWRDEHEDPTLFDGPPDVYGCKAALARLPYDDRDILLFSAPSPKAPNRHDITVWVSFDGGETWPVSRLIRKGPGNYTWMAVGRNGTPSEGMVYVAAGKDWMARFNLAWLFSDSEERPKGGISGQQ